MLFNVMGFFIPPRNYLFFTVSVYFVLCMDLQLCISAYGIQVNHCRLLLNSNTRIRKFCYFPLVIYAFSKDRPW